MDMVQRAPAREMLHMFGGPLSIKQFRDLSAPLPNIIQEEVYPMSRERARIMRVRRQILEFIT